jgi:serine/threonine protein kinase/predicted RNA-binding Zn-ribbon protein involved in translation (DUF1610 family)
MPAAVDCPGMECWQALFRGALPPGERERWARHLESCPSCQERLDRTEELGEALRRPARRVGDPTLAAPDPAWSQFLERLRGVRSPVRVGPEEPPDLDFLRPADRPGLLGTLGPYEVREVIGQGGMGVVLKAFDPALHRLVAVKVLSPALAGSATARRRFTREAQAAAAVCHDHVVAVHGVSEADGLPYLVMQYVAGESLQDRLDRCGPLEPGEVVRIGLQTASALAAAHAQGLIHRDVKPANLLLEGGLARVKVTDFGLARMVADVGLTQAGVVAGTPEYMAPEQARGEQVDHRSDLFSLGGVLYACCTGLPPFRGPTALAVLRQVGDEAPTPVRSLNPGVPAWLEGLIARLMAKDPAQRLKGAAEVAALLERYLAHLRQPATVPAPKLPPAPADVCLGSATPRLRGAPARRVPQRLGLTALVVMTVLGLGWIAFGVPGDGGKPGEWQEVFSYDFRGRPVPAELTVVGDDGGQFVRTEPEGLRISLPGNREKPAGVALTAPFVIQGDMDITATFQILKAEEPDARASFGVGVMLRADKAESREWATLARLARPQGRQVVFWDRAVPGPDGRPRMEAGEEPATATSGRLRLKRTGTTLHYLWTPDTEGDQFQEVHQCEFGAEDLTGVQVAAATARQARALDVRLIDLRIRNGGLAPDGAAAFPQKVRSRRWLLTALTLGLVFTLVLGGWLYVQRRRGAKGSSRAAVEDGQARLNAADPSASLPCPGCGKKLRIKAELAGKQVKCPQCGAAFHVPGTAPSAPTPGRPG